MLVLTRESQEAVIVSGSDRFRNLHNATALEIERDRESLGFEVDVSVPTHRVEVWEQIHGGQPGSMARTLPAPQGGPVCKHSLWS
jgi:sRNA-binding carbon storage regulator CsrA